MKIEYFVISLERDESKRISAFSQLDGIRNRVNWVKGIEGKSLVISEHVDAEKCKKTISRNLTAGEVGCALSHISAYKEIIEKSLDYGVVFEDDIVIEKGFSESVLDIILTKIDFDILLIGHHPRYSRHHPATLNKSNASKIDSYFSVGYFSEQPTGGYGYIISKAYAIKRVREFEKIYKPIDVWSTDDSRVYGVFPEMIKVNYSFASNIDSEGERSKVIKRKGYLGFKDIVKGVLEKLSIYLLIERARSKYNSYFVIKMPERQ